MRCCLLKSGLRRVWAKIWKNRFHNRLWILLGGRLFLRIPALARSHHPSNISHGLIRSGQVRVYRSIETLLSKKVATEWAATAPHHGMFGNSVAGLMPKVALAIEHNFRAVFAIGESPFAARDLFDAEGEHETDRKFKIAIHESPKDAATKGIQGLVHATCTLPSSGENSERAWSNLSSVLLKRWSLLPLGPKTLVIHLRGGDVYWGKRDLPNHGPPPLSFYTAIIESEAWDDVLVVHQGDVPHLASIIDFCSARGVAISTQALSLKEDIRTLLGATTLVAGRGSFLPAIAGLAPNLERVFFFESGFGLAVPRPSVALCRAEDASKKYVTEVLSNNWKRSQEQLQLLLEYPQSEIRLPKCL